MSRPVHRRAWHPIRQAHVRDGDTSGSWLCQSRGTWRSRRGRVWRWWGGRLPLRRQDMESKCRQTRQSPPCGGLPPNTAPWPWMSRLRPRWWPPPAEVLSRRGCWRLREMIGRTIWAIRGMLRRFQALRDRNRCRDRLKESHETMVLPRGDDCCCHS